MSTPEKKIILVIGGTGAQGIAVIDALLAPGADGAPSPYRVRVLTRNAASARAAALAQQPGVELFEGSSLDLEAVRVALDGAYGAFVNTDSFTLGEEAELYNGVRIFEIAKGVKGLKHYVWSSLDYIAKLTNYDPAYKSDHYDAKARVGEIIANTPSDAGDDGFAWTQLLTGPYMDMLNESLGPIGTRASDGATVFAYPLGNGSLPLVALSDIAFFARHIFDNRASTSGTVLPMLSDFVSGAKLAQAYTNVTGKRAAYIALGDDEFFGGLVKGGDKPIAKGHPAAQSGEKTAGGMQLKTWNQNFRATWRLWREGVIKRDMEWVRSVNPGTVDVETWMRREGYTGARRALLADAETRGLVIDEEKRQEILSRA